MQQNNSCLYQLKQVNNFNIKLVCMLAQYVMKGIDNLFTSQINPNLSKREKNHPKTERKDLHFDKEGIKNTLHRIIRKENETRRSPTFNEGNQPSPKCKSRLKILLEKEKEQRINSVLKRDKKADDWCNSSKVRNENSAIEDRIKTREGAICNKDSNIIKYYQQLRKSVSKQNKNQRSVLHRQKSNRKCLQISTLSKIVSKRNLKVERF